MKAVVYDRYGAPEVLRLSEVPVPVAGDGEVLVRLGAVSVNLSDWETLTHCAQMLERFGVAHESRVVSAHRTPGWMVQYAMEAVNKGLEMTLAEGLYLEAVLFGASCATADKTEGTTAFLEKRPAQFKGK